MSNPQNPTKISIENESKSLESNFTSRKIWKFFILALIGSSATYSFQMTYLYMFNKDFSYFCVPPGFEGKNFTDDDILLLSTSDDADICTVFDLDYLKLFKNFSNYDQFIDFAISNNDTTLMTDLTSCFDVGGKFKFDIERGEDIAADFEIVCEKLDEFSLIKAISLGFLMGSIFLGICGDKIGRKKTITIASIPFVILSFLFALTPTLEALYWIHVALSFLSEGILNIIFVIVVENFNGKFREVFTILLNLGFPILVGLSSLMAMEVTQWRFFFGIMAVIVLVSMIFLNFITESPRFLHTKTKKVEEVKDKIQISSQPLKLEDNFKISKFIKSQEVFKIFSSSFAINGVSHNSYKPTLTFMLILPFLWFTFSYSGNFITQNPLNLHQTSFFSLIDAFGFIFTALLTTRFSRKRLEILFMCAFGVSMIFAFSVPEKSEIYQVLWNITRGFINPTISLMTLHLLEIFPTEIRSTAFGVANASGTAVNYYVVELTDALNGLTHNHHLLFVKLFIGILTTLSCGLIMMLPETKFAELENFCERESEKSRGKKFETESQSGTRIFVMKSSTIFALTLFTLMSVAVLFWK